MKNRIDEYAISLLWENELPLGEVKKEITNEITFLELCKQNQGIATRQSPEIFHMKNYFASASAPSASSSFSGAASYSPI